MCAHVSARDARTKLRELLTVLSSPAGLRMFKRAYRENMLYKVRRYEELLARAEREVQDALEVVRIRREAYPTRLPFATLHAAFARFVQCALGGRRQPATLGFDPWTHGPNQCSASQSRAACEHLAQAFLDPSRYQLGKTLIFLRDGANQMWRACVLKTNK